MDESSNTCMKFSHLFQYDYEGFPTNGQALYFTPVSSSAVIAKATDYKWM